jgi:hypothetical protein
MPMAKNGLLNKHWKLGMARFDLSHNSTNASTNVNCLPKICSFLFMSCTSFIDLFKAFV